MNRLKEDMIFEGQNDKMIIVLEKFFNNVLDCIVISDFEQAK